MLIELRPESFQPYEEIKSFEAELKDKGKYGATAHFIGTMRDHNDGDQVSDMSLEHYPGMTEKHLKEIADCAAERWNIIDALVLHRIGTVSVSEAIVLVSVWSEHRLDAFESCRFIMEDLKSKAPFWKKETLADGERWVEKNTQGYSG